MDFIKDFIDNKYLWIIIIVIITIVREYVSTRNITDIEKKFMTDFQRFKYESSNVIFVNIPFLLFLLPTTLIIAKRNPEMTEKDQIFYFWSIFGVSAFILIAFTSFLRFLIEILIVKLDYIIVTEEGIKVKVMRRVDDNSILVKSNRSKKRLMNDWYNKDIIVQLNKEAIIHRVLYAHEKRTKLVQIITAVISGIGLISTIIGIKLKWSNIICFSCFLTFIITFVIFVLLVVNLIDYKKYDTIKTD